VPRRPPRLLAPSARPGHPAVARAAGLALGLAADLALADPRRGHPVAGFGRAAGALERRLYADDARRGALFTAVAVGLPTVLAAVAERAVRRRPVAGALLTAAATWAVLGGTSLVREGQAMASHLEGEQLDAARHRLRNLCARDPSGLGPDELARATVESLAENTADAAVAPLVWGALAGLPGLVGYRAVNTLDAMVGYRNERYLRFGRASARLDDLVNLLPSRVTAGLTVLVAGRVGGSPAQALRVWRRDGGKHPSPNAGQCESAAAGALGVRLGGRNTYGSLVEDRPALGDGPAPRVGDVRRAARLARLVTLAGGVLAVVAVAGPAAFGRARRRARARMQ
jgi:adenosylcobinamide-phosphate synthase